MANRLVRQNVDFSEASGESADDWGDVGSPWWNERANWRHRLKWALLDKERQARLARGEGSAGDIIANLGMMPVHMIQGIPEIPASLKRTGEFVSGHSLDRLPDETQEEYVARIAGQPSQEALAVESAMNIMGVGGRAHPPVTNKLVAFGRQFGREPAEILPPGVRTRGPEPAPMSVAEYKDFTAHAGGSKELAALTVLAGEKRGGFYSALGKAIDAMPDKELTPAEWRKKLIVPGKEAQRTVRDKETNKPIIDPETGKPKTEAYQIEPSSPVPGLKPVELNPLDAFLKHEEEIRSRPGSNLPPTVSKEEILDHIATGLPELREWQRGGRGSGEWKVSMREDGAYQVVDEEGNAYQPHRDEYQQNEFTSPQAAQRYMMTLDELPHAPNKASKYSRWTLEGGENKREIGLQVHPEEESADWKVVEHPETTISKPYYAIQNARGDYGLNPNGQGIRVFGDPESAARAAADEYAPVVADDYYGPHWSDDDEINTFAHARVDERSVLADGYVVEHAESGNKSPVFKTFEEAEAYQKKLPQAKSTVVVKTKGELKALHVDEQQSDLHQEGRKYGYKTPESKAKRLADLEEARKEIEQAHDNYNVALDKAIEFVKTKGPPATSVHRANVVFALRNMSQFKELNIHPDLARAAKEMEFTLADKKDAIRKAETDRERITLSGEKQPPDVPFKNTEQWSGLLVKRMIQEAVALGKEAITWTTGAIQKKRFALTNHIKELRYEPVLESGETKYLLSARTSQTGESVKLNDGIAVPAKDLDGIIGAEMAAKIVKGEGRDAGKPGLKFFDNVDLDVGGKGMEGYYDDILPKIINKIAGKYGAKLEKGEALGARPKPDEKLVARERNKFQETVDASKGQLEAELKQAKEDMLDDFNKLIDDGLSTVAATEKVTEANQAAREAAWGRHNDRMVAADRARRAAVDASVKHPEVHVLRITPELAEAASGEGFTLYAGGKRGAAMFGLLKPVEEGNKLGFAPDLRVRVPRPGKLPDKPLITQTTTNKNAQVQLDNVDLLLAGFPKATESPKDWSKMMAHAFASDEVPIPPYAFIRDINSDGAAQKIGSLTPGQIADADHGFAEAAKMRAAYEAGRLSPVTTGKLFFWSFLSRGVSPYTQESLFIDAFHGINDWIRKAARGEFTAKDVADYKAWAATTAPKGGGQPGSGALHNLNAFGTHFLRKMSQIGEAGISKLQRLHNMLADPEMTGPQIRREFLKLGEGVGIDNKVVSFTLLVAGKPDVMVIDRVQTRQLWDDGRFADRNIYDGVKVNKKVVTGTALSNLTYGARGLLIYEAIERALGAKIADIYAAAGRKPQDASIGRYHWESWVAHSQQEASHGSLGAVMEDALGQRNVPAISTVSAKEGEYGAYAYGARYARDEEGHPYFSYTTPVGNTYEFTVPAWRQFLDDVKKRKAKVVPKGFKVTESGNAPWYERPGVDPEALDRLASSRSDRGAVGSGGGAVRGAEQGQVAGGPAGRSTADDWQRDPIVAPPGVRLTPVDHDPFAGEPK